MKLIYLIFVRTFLNFLARCFQAELKSSPRDNAIADVDLDHMDNSEEDTKKETVNLKCDEKIQILKEQNLTISSLKQHISIQECILHSSIN